MKCPNCLLEWTPPPTTCPKCRNAAQAPESPAYKKPVVVSQSVQELAELPTPEAPGNKWSYGDDGELPQLLAEEEKFRRLRTPSKTTAITSIVWGIINTICGMSAVQYNPTNFVLVLLGASLVGEGVWLLSAEPSSLTCLVDGVILLLLGLWNVGLTASHTVANGNDSFFLIIGVLQIIWSIKRFSAMKKLQNRI